MQPLFDHSALNDGTRKTHSVNDCMISDKNHSSKVSLRCFTFRDNVCDVSFFAQYIMAFHVFQAPSFYTPPHFSVGVLCYTFRCLSVRPSVRPCSPFPIDNLSIYSRNFFKFCIHIVFGDEWYGIVNGQNPSIFNGVTALFRIGKMVSGLLFLYCS